MMAMKKARFAETYSTGFHPNLESEGSDCSARLDGSTAYLEDSMASRQKWIDLNSTSRDSFGVPLQVTALHKLTSSEKKSLFLRLKSELEKIQALQKKCDLLMSNNVSVTNVPRGLHSGLVSKPGKKPSSLPNKARGWKRGSTGRFEAVNVPGHGSNSNASPAIMKMCENVLKKLMSHQYGWVFNTPVDAVKLNIPDYYTVIKHPMDLGTIKKKLASGEYPSPLEFCADVKLTFSNAKTYNPPGNDVHIMAEAMSKFFELKWKEVEKKFPDKTAPTKKRKLSPPVIEEPVKPKMTMEEKLKLSSELESLLEDLPETILGFLRQQISNAGESAEDEIEIDIEELNDDALFTLRKLLDEHSLEKQKIAEKGEPCEIELPNEPGLSSSSLQADKGNDPVDEDCDIGEDEPPVSSYATVEIERDKSKSPRLGRSDSEQDVVTRNPSDGAFETGALTCVKPTLDVSGDRASHDNESAEDLADESVIGFDQRVHSSLEKPNSDETESPLDGESAPAAQAQLSPEKQYRVALLKNRFAETILKAQEKTLGEVEKGDPEKLRRKREELELRKSRERARLQAEAKAAEDARRRAEEAAAAEARKKRELEREAARQALLKIEQTVEINENSRFLEDLEMLRAGSLEQLPSCVEETSPDDPSEEGGFGSFKFGAGNNPLEQLGLYMKVDEEDEDGEQQHNHDNPPPPPSLNDDDVEEGEID